MSILNNVKMTSLVALIAGLLIGSICPVLAQQSGEGASQESGGEPGQAIGAAEGQSGQLSQTGQVSKSEQIHHETSKDSEEFLLNDTLKHLKANELGYAIANLERLKNAFPDNDDYLLLYRTALRKKNSSDSDSQKWWAYERSLEQKDRERLATLGAAKASLSAPGAGRINQLKHATWLVLTTGKHKSPNEGRRAQKSVSHEQD